MSSTHSITRIARTPVSACRFVDITGAHAANALAAVGISEQSASVGEAFAAVTGYSSPVEAAEPLAVGDLVKPAADGSGRAAKGTTGDCCGRVMEAATAAGKFAEIRFLDIQAASVSGGRILLPSGGADDDAMLANYLSNNGRLLLGPGVFRLSQRLTLEGVRKWRGSTTTYWGPHIVGAGIGVTIVDTSGITVKTHDTVQVSGIAVGASTVITFTSSPGKPDGSRAILQMPSWLTGVDTPGSTVDRLNGVIIYIKHVSGNDYQLYHDKALSNAVNSTGWAFGTVANIGNASNPVYARFYSDDYTVDYQPIIRICAPYVSAGLRGELMQPRVRGVTFENAAVPADNSGPVYPSGYDRQGVLIAFESNSTTIDTNTCQGLVVHDVAAHGYDAAILTDDCTNNDIQNSDFQNNNYTLWAGYNTDITSFKQTRFGDDLVVPNAALQHVMVPALRYYSPLGGRGPTGCNSVSFDSCWFMGVLAASQHMSANAVISGATGTSALRPASLTFDNSYFEQVRRIADASRLSVRNCHFGNVIRDSALTNDECLFSCIEDNTKSRIDFSGNTSDMAAGTGPKYGWLMVRTFSGSAQEILTPDVSWRNNALPWNSSTGCHLRSNSGRKVSFPDGVGTGDASLGAGEYFLEGQLQTGGKRRVTKTANNFSGTYTPYLLEASTFYLGAMNGAVTVANPLLATGDGTTFVAEYPSATNGLGGSSNFMHAPLRMLPIQFIFEQDATGGRTVAFGTDFVTNGFVNGSAATAGQKTILEFRWTGTKFVQVAPNVWA